MADALATLIARIEDAALRTAVQTEVSRLRAKRTFGLVFESHLPERVQLPDHPIRVGVPVALRDGLLSELFEVLEVRGAKATIAKNRPDESDSELPVATALDVDVADLVVVADFGQAIYPGLRKLGDLSRGGAKPAHLVIKGENHHVLEALQFTHAGKVDCIYIDPPYNSGARWKYDNNYVDENDSYKHSKWLAFVERRLNLAKSLLNPENSVLVVMIDEKEYLRLGLLLQQVFPGCAQQMVSITTNPKGASRPDEFARVDEFAFFVMVGAASVPAMTSGAEDAEIRWPYLRRSDVESARGTKKGGPRQFYPIYVDEISRTIVEIGEPLSPEEPLDGIKQIVGTTAVLPIREDGKHMNWGLTGPTLQKAVDGGYVRVTDGQHEHQPFTISYLTTKAIERVESGELIVTGRRDDGSKIVVIPGGKATRPTTVWRESSHDAGSYGTSLLGELIPDRKFPFPKSLYAVEDILRLFVKDKPEAIILDFFAGSGTTAHAVARLNRQDGGSRHSISVTNNEVSEAEEKALAAKGLRPGNPEWEALGIFDFITRPRITAAVTGTNSNGERLAQDYKFVDEFPMAEGFAENVQFMELTYLDPEDVELDLAFAGIAPLLWMRAGSVGPILTESVDAAGRRRPYAWTERYGVLFNPDRWRGFVSKVPSTATTAFIVTDSQATFSGVAAELPQELDAVRLYSNYLTTFAINGAI